MKTAILCLCLFSVGLNSQPKENVVRTIAFYNVENLFDTIDQEDTFDEDYTKDGRNHYTSNDYKMKISGLSEVIAKIGSKRTAIGPDLIGLSEIENAQVLFDLVDQPALDSLSLGIIHENSPDRRGIDVALLYRQAVFFPLEYDNVEVQLWDKEGNRIYTRDVLWVHGIMDAEELHILVNHWPSRRGGSSESSHRRMKAAWVNKKIISRISQSQPEAKILIMGDFNDDPVDDSIKVGLSSKSKGQLNPGDFFNPMEKMYNMGWNTMVYRDQVHLFDQILLSRPLLKTTDNSSFKFMKAGIYNPEILIAQEGKYKGYPLRSFQNGKYSKGYSDHYPVYVQISKSR